MVLAILENGLVGDRSLAPAQLDLLDCTVLLYRAFKGGPN